MRPSAWSFSALEGFNTCPKQFWHTRVAKDVFAPPGEAAEWGNYVHEHFEKYLKGEITVLPANIRQYTEYLDRIKASPGTMYVEREYALNRDLKPVRWMAPDVWCRLKQDVVHVNGEHARVIDHKTGKMKDGSRQLKLAALMVFIHHPQVQYVRSGFFWLKVMKLTKADYTREQEAELWAEFIPDLRAYAQAFTREMFPPKPSGLCNGWCPVQTCDFWKAPRVKK